MHHLLSSQQLGEVRLAVSFLQSSPLARQIKLMLGHIDAQAELINDQAAIITARDQTIAAQARDIEAGKQYAIAVTKHVDHLLGLTRQDSAMLDLVASDPAYADLLARVRADAAARTQAERAGRDPVYQRLIAEGRAIRCPQCGWVSHNENDVAQKYCGHCHQFHEFMAAEASGGS